MNAKAERKVMNFAILFFLIKGIHVYKKGLKNPGYIDRIQRKNIKKFVAYAYTFPFYRKRFEQAGVKPGDIRTEEDFAKLPVLTKSEYRKWIEAEVAANPQKYRYFIKNSTSGSTGIPLTLYQRPFENASDIANLYRGIWMQRRGYRLVRDKILQITVYAGARKSSVVQRLGFFRAHFVGINDGYDKIIEEINTFRPDCIETNKAVLSMLIEKCRAEGIALHCPKVIWSMAEKLDDVTRNLVNEFFGREVVFDGYGSTETGNFAIERLDTPNIKTVWHDTHVLNFANAHDNADGSITGDILITPLKHTGFPLINYMLGDSVCYSRNLPVQTWGGGDNGCARKEKHCA